MIAVINLFPELSKLEQKDLEFFNEKYSDTSEYFTKENLSELSSDKEYNIVISYNSTVLFHEQTLKNIPGTEKLQEVVNKATKRVLYKKNKHIIGLNLFHQSKHTEVLLTPKIKVMVAIPCYSYTHYQTMKSVYDLIIPENVEVELHFITGYTVVQARNKLVNLSLNNGFDYTLFVDSDIVLQSTTLINLLKHNKDIATGWYIKKIPGGPRITELYGPDKLSQNVMVNINEDELPKDGRLLKILGCGFGCTLVKNSLFTKMSLDENINKMWFLYVEKPTGELCSEDIDFCMKATKLGAEIIADTSLRCSHIGVTLF